MNIELDSNGILPGVKAGLIVQEQASGTDESKRIRYNAKLKMALFQALEVSLWM